MPWARFGVTGAPPRARQAEAADEAAARRRGGAALPAAQPTQGATWSTTVVTALFDIERGRFDGRDLASYLHWFRATLALPVPMVVFTPPGPLADFVLLQRASQLFRTRVVTTELADLPYAQYRGRIAALQASARFLANVRELHRVECRLPDYVVIQAWGQAR